MNALIGLRRTLFAAAALFLALVSPGAAIAQTGSLYIAHGLPGRDVAGSFDPTLPVDIAIDSSLCPVRNAVFGDIDGPFLLPAGTHTITVRVASVSTPCGGSVLLGGSVTLAAGQTASLVAGLSGSNQPTLIAVGIDFSSVPSGQSRFIIIHAAGTAAIDVKIGAPNGTVTVSSIVPGTAAAAVVNAGSTAIAAFETGTSTNISGTDAVFTRSNSVTLLYVVGSSANNSIAFISRVVREVL